MENGGETRRFQLAYISHIMCFVSYVRLRWQGLQQG